MVLTSVALIPVVLGVLGLIAAFGIYRVVLKYPAGTGKVAAIAELIHRGALVFIHREYSFLSIFVIVVAALIFFSDLGWRTAVAFLLGAGCSAAAGYIGMFAATRANVRTTTAAQESAPPRKPPYRTHESRARWSGHRQKSNTTAQVPAIPSPRQSIP